MNMNHSSEREEMTVSEEIQQDAATHAEFGEGAVAEPRPRHKRENLVSLLAGTVLFVLHILALSVLGTNIGSVSGYGFGSNLPEVSTLSGIMALMAAGVDFSQMFNLYYYLILLVAWLVIAIVMLVNLVRSVINRKRWRRNWLKCSISPLAGHVASSLWLCSVLCQATEFLSVQSCSWP